MNFLQNIPKPILVFVVLTLGLIFIVYWNPPHSVCDTQKEVFLENQKGNLFPIKVKSPFDKKRIVTIPAKLKEGIDNCKIANSSGGCYEFFTIIRKMLLDLESAPSECVAPLGELPQVKAAMNSSIELIVRIAWGEEPPLPGNQRFSWLESTDLSVFCKLKRAYENAYGEEQMSMLRNYVYTKLPGVVVQGQRKLSSDELWQRSLFSLRCELYL